MVYYLVYHTILGPWLYHGYVSHNQRVKYDKYKDVKDFPMIFPWFSHKSMDKSTTQMAGHWVSTWIPWDPPATSPRPCRPPYGFPGAAPRSRGSKGGPGAKQRDAARRKNDRMGGPPVMTVMWMLVKRKHQEITIFYSEHQKMWVKQCHKPSPSHHHFLYVVWLPFPVMGGLWRCFNHITPISGNLHIFPQDGTPSDVNVGL